MKSFLSSYTRSINEETNQGENAIELPNELKLNLTNTDFLLIENIEDSSSQAIVLRLTAFLEYNERKLDRIIESCFQSFEVFSCNIDAIEESAMTIIDPIIINLQIKQILSFLPNNTIPEEFIAEINTDILKMRLSYLDIIFLTRIFESVRLQLNGKKKFF